MTEFYMRTAKQRLLGLLLMVFGVTAHAQTPGAKLTQVLDSAAVHLNETLNHALVGDVGGAVVGVGDLAGGVVVELSADTPASALSNSTNNVIDLVTTTLNGAATAPLTGLVQPILTSGGRVAPTNIAVAATDVLLGQGFPVLGSGPLGPSSDLALTQILRNDLGNGALIAETLGLFGPNGSLVGVGFAGGGLPLLGGLLANPAAVPLLGPILAGADSGGAVPALGGLLGGGLMIGNGPGLSLDALPLPAESLDLATRRGLTSGVTLSGLGGP